MPGGFTHAGQGVRVVELLEKQGQGLNLTWEVRDGILNHRTSGSPATLEGHVVRLSDKIAYINHDIDDAIRAKLFTEEDLPSEYTDILGHSVRERLNTMIHDLIYQSLDRPEIVMSPGMEAAMHGLRRWMFENVYSGKRQPGRKGRAQQLAASLYHWYVDHPDQLPREYLDRMETRKEELSRTVCDYVAGMTDVFAIERFKELFVPKSFKV